MLSRNGLRDGAAHELTPGEADQLETHSSHHTDNCWTCARGGAGLVRSHSHCRLWIWEIEIECVVLRRLVVPARHKPPLGLHRVSCPATSAYLSYVERHTLTDK